MSEKTTAVPKGYEGLTPYITVKNCTEAIEFYKRAFAAQELFRLPEMTERSATPS